MNLPLRVLDGLTKRTSGFDFLIGSWSVENLRLTPPLSDDGEWRTSSATATATTLHNGAISVDEMWFPDAGFAGTSFRYYTNADDTWTIHWVNSETGRLQAPVMGRWSPDASTFVAEGPDDFEGIPIVARYMWHSIMANRATWEQAFSVDDGKSWKTNWIMNWTRASGTMVST